MQRLFAVLLVLCFVAACYAQAPFQNVTQLIQAAGYPVENHVVQTPDGYLIQIQRIPYSQKSGPNTPKRVIFLQHGLLDSSSTWVILGAGQGLAFMLADSGFDVWLGNTRGNRYGLGHVTLNYTQAAFWNWNWDQYVSTDLPAKLNYVLNITGADKFAYVGHSEGTMTGFALFSSPAYAALAKRVALYIPLAPVMFLAEISVPLLVDLAKLPDDMIFALLGNKSVLSYWNDVDRVLPLLCTFFQRDCEDVLCYLSGCENFQNVDPDKLNIYLAHFPAGTSVQNLIHYAQSVDTDTYQHYDYGNAQQNQLHYNQSMPPPYAPQQLSVPYVVFRGGKDTLADTADWEHIAPQLPKPLMDNYIADYGHGDFVLGSDAPTVIYEPLIQQLNQYFPPPSA